MKDDRWVAVSERMPPDGETVVTCSPGDWTVEIMFRRGERWFFELDDEEADELEVPTHWAPLPRPIKGGMT